jgi:hypothetical protein
MKHTDLLIPYKDFPSPNHCLQMIEMAAHGKTWRWLGVAAVNDRVLWEPKEDGVLLHYSEILKATR